MEIFRMREQRDNRQPLRLSLCSGVHAAEKTAEMCSNSHDYHSQ